MTDPATEQQTAAGESLPEAGAIERYRRDGHVTLKGVATGEHLAGLRAAVCAAVEEDLRIQPQVPLGERDTYGRAFLQQMNLWVRYPQLREYVQSSVLGRIAAELMGVDGVRLYHDQALFKEPGGGFTPWHQDQYYWPVDTDHTITMWMPLVDVESSMGMLTFASQSHTKGYLGTLPISDESEAVLDNYVREQGYPLHRETAMAAGDATFHSGWTLHAAPGNDSDRMREVMTIIWVADGCRVTEPVNANQARDITRWMPGLQPGDPVASELNPLVYQREAHRAPG